MPTRVNPEELTCWKLLEIGLCDDLNGNAPLGHRKSFTFFHFSERSSWLALALARCFGASQGQSWDSCAARSVVYRLSSHRRVLVSGDGRNAARPAAALSACILTTTYVRTSNDPDAVAGRKVRLTKPEVDELNRLLERIGDHLTQQLGL